jgi:uncharacterized protein YuzE
MRLEYDPQADAVYIYLTDKRYAYGKDLDDQRRIDYADDNTPMGIELLCVSNGVNLSDLPHSQEIGKLLAEKAIKTYQIQDMSKIETVSGNATVLQVTWAGKEDVYIFEPVKIRPKVNVELSANPERQTKNERNIFSETVTR